MEEAIEIISEVIKKLRTKLGYTQKQVADLLGVDRSTYSYYELGRIKPDVKTIMKLSEIFKVHYTKILESEMTYRFSDTGNSSNQCDDGYTKNMIENLSPEEHSALMAFKILPEDSKNEVIDLINKKFKDFGDAKRIEKFSNLFE